MRQAILFILLGITVGGGSGCSLIPDVTHQPIFHNPFPQLHRVAVLPFVNQSKDPTVDGDAVALAYYHELQGVRGFEVMPVGVAKRLVQASGLELHTAEDFQKLARFMGVDALVVGSVTDYTPYYPPRMGLAVNWYAANPNFHPIPAGYGLPWGTPHEEDIPEEIVFDAEFALAREQLATQTPDVNVADNNAALMQGEQALAANDNHAALAPGNDHNDDNAASTGGASLPPAQAEMSVPPPATPLLPEGWPDPRGFIPAPPSLTRPVGMPQSEPVMTHTRIYLGNDADFTAKLERYFYYQDDARFGGWQSYLQRSEDFTRFCCHLHVTEMLASRGGVSKPRVVYRWPISRYER
jgi:hypothetical protein